GERDGPGAVAADHRAAGGAEGVGRLAALRRRRLAPRRGRRRGLPRDRPPPPAARRRRQDAPRDARPAARPAPGPRPRRGPAPAVAAGGFATKSPEFVGPPKPDVAVATAPAAEQAPLPRAAVRRDPFTAAVADPVVFAKLDARLPVLFPIADATEPELIRKVK